VVRLWEHELRTPARGLGRIRRVLSSARVPDGSRPPLDGQMRRDPIGRLTLARPQEGTRSPQPKRSPNSADQRRNG